jgi:hypothetical protein
MTLRKERILTSEGGSSRSYSSISVVATKPLVHPEDGDGVGSKNGRKLPHTDAAVCPGKCRYSVRKLYLQV